MRIILHLKSSKIHQRFQIALEKCRTPLKSAAVRGPEETKRENCWCVRGGKGERCSWHVGGHQWGGILWTVRDHRLKITLRSPGEG